MNITPVHIKSKKVVGKLRGHPVHQITTTGGLVIIAASKNGKTETLGVGAHPGISKHVAEQNESDIVWTDLQKSEALDPGVLALEAPRWIAVTAAIRGE